MNLSKTNHAIGVDIGGTTIKSGIVNHKGEIVFAGKALSTGLYSLPLDFVEALYTSLAPAIKIVGIENIKGIGIGAPNGNIYRGTIEQAPNLPWKGVVPMAALIAERFKLPCALTNDANAAAVGEMMYGAAIGMKDFIVLTLGTGVGSGIVANGQLIYGHDGFAGELGHTFIRRGRKHWSTGLDGSLEVYASATGIGFTTRLFLKSSSKPSLLREFNVSDIDAKLVCDCALKGDQLAQEVFEYTGQILGEALANFIMVTSPEVIILFGGVTKAGDLLLTPTKEHMERNLLPIFQNKIQLILSELKEADAAILGASALVWGMKTEEHQKTKVFKELQF